jgi:hypothetical protein
MADDLATELLVRILRDKKLDARHLSIEDLKQMPPPEAVPGSVSMVYVVSAAPGEERNRAVATAEEIRARIAGALLVGLYLPGATLSQEPSIDTLPSADKSATSLVEALEVCLDWIGKRAAA